MTDLAIDTHRFVKQLMESGFTEAQAETLADAQMALLESRLATKAEMQQIAQRLDEMATKADLAELRTEPKADMAELRAEFKTDIAELRGEMNTMRGEMNTMRGEMNTMRGEFGSMLLRSQITTGAAIITILTFIDYLTR